jgi:hypothetical protein
MRKLLVMVLLVVSAGALYAEPLLLQQADNVLQPKTLEVGLSDILYQYDLTKITDAAGNVVQENKVSATLVPLFARYGISPKLEAMLQVPYETLNTDFGGVTASKSALADSVIGVKYVLADDGNVKKGLALVFSVPTGDSAFRHGIDIEPVFSLRKVGPRGACNFNLSYDITTEYSDANSFKQNPGDVLSVGIGIERTAKFSDNFTWITEFVYRSITQASSAGVATPNSSGSQMDWSVGGRYNTGDWKTKLGLGLALGDESYRTYDYKVIAGVTYLIKI